MHHKPAVLLGLVCGALAAAAYSAASAGNATSAAAEVKDDSIKVPPLDEVIINGHRERLSQLKADVDKAQDAFFEAFNHVNTVKEYETHCDMEMANDTHIPRRVCNPQFVHAATQEEAKMALGPPGAYCGIHAGSCTVTVYLARPARMVINGKMPAYHKYVHDLVHQNPKLSEALGRYFTLKQYYEAVRKEKLKGKWFVWD